MLKFVYQIASSLIRAGTVVNQVGRPPKRRSLELDVVRRTPSEPEPIADIQFDNVSHCSEFRADKRKCRVCKTDQSRGFCKKCNICFCLSNARNCFTEYNTKQTCNWRADYRLIFFIYDTVLILCSIEITSLSLYTISVDSF